MGHIDYCSLCKYVYTKDCNYGSKECNQEKARIMLEVSRFEKMGAADVQPIRHGRWIAENRDKRGYADCYTCSNCNNYTYMYTLMKDCEHEYCPNCGARMDLNE